MVMKPWLVCGVPLGRQQVIGVLLGGVLLWSVVALPGAPRRDSSFYAVGEGQAWPVARPNVDLGKGLDGTAGAAECRPAAQARVCVRLPADWAAVEDARRGALARYFASVFWASAETGATTEWPRARR